MSKLTKNFGDDEGNEINFNGTVIQALLLMNGKEINELLTKADNNTVANVMKSHPGGSIADDLALAALGRKAGNDGTLLKGTDPSYCQDFLWALINSPEFILNH